METERSVRGNSTTISSRPDLVWTEMSCFHYEITPMLSTAIFQGCKNNNFQMKKSDIFLNFTQNIDRWYLLEPPR